MIFSHTITRRAIKMILRPPGEFGSGHPEFSLLDLLVFAAEFPHARDPAGFYPDLQEKVAEPGFFNMLLGLIFSSCKALERKAVLIDLGDTREKVISAPGNSEVQSKLGNTGRPAQDLAITTIDLFGSEMAS